MIEWVLIMDLTYASQKIQISNEAACYEAMRVINKDEYITGTAFCLNTLTGKIIKWDNEDRT